MSKILTQIQSLYVSRFFQISILILTHHKYLSQQVSNDFYFSFMVQAVNNLHFLLRLTYIRDKHPK